MWVGYGRWLLFDRRAPPVIFSAQKECGALAGGSREKLSNVNCVGVYGDSNPDLRYIGTQNVFLMAGALHPIADEIVGQFFYSYAGQSIAPARQK